MERHAIVSMRWHAMVRRGNEGANEGGLGQVWHALAHGPSSPMVSTAVPPPELNLDRPERG
jgi:hypothetical protein